MGKHTKYLLATGAATLVGLAAVTSQSLWIDEGSAALKVIQPTLVAWWKALRMESDSNLQLLFQLSYLWAWEKIFGSSEFALRAANVPWFALAAAALMTMFPKRPMLQAWLLIVTLTNSFLWYYLSEARPYIVLFAFSTITATSLLRLHADREIARSTIWFCCFCIGITGLCLTSFVAVPWALGAIFASAYLVGATEGAEILYRFRYLAWSTLVILITLASYYVWTIRIGASASNVGRTGISNIFFIAYEFSGLSGLGPGRLELREHGAGAFRPYLISLTLGGLALLSLLLAGSSVIKAKRRSLLFFLLLIGVPSLLVIVAGYFRHMRLLGRHFMPLMPYVLAFLAIGLERLFSSSRIAFRLLSVIMLGFFLYSCWDIRFAPRHERDDYRSAVALARAALTCGEQVWWCADIDTAAYYKLPLGSPTLTLASRASERSPDGLPYPDVVIISKPDIYDSTGQIESYLQRNNFALKQNLPAFRIFRRPD